MTFEEFLSLKPGDFVLLDDRFVPDYICKPCSLKVANTNPNYYLVNNVVLCFTSRGWGQPISGWMSTFNLPSTDGGKWAKEFHYSSLFKINR